MVFPRFDQRKKVQEASQFSMSADLDLLLSCPWWREVVKFQRYYKRPASSFHSKNWNRELKREGRKFNGLWPKIKIEGRHDGGDSEIPYVRPLQNNLELAKDEIQQEEQPNPTKLTIRWCMHARSQSFHASTPCRSALQRQRLAKNWEIERGRERWGKQRDQMGFTARIVLQKLQCT